MQDFLLSFAWEDQKGPFFSFLGTFFKEGPRKGVPQKVFALKYLYSLFCKTEKDNRNGKRL